MATLLQILVWLIFSIVPVLFGLYFGYIYSQDKDKRKLMFTLAFIFASLAFIGKIIPQSLGLFFVDQLYSFATLPLVMAVFLTLFSSIKNVKNFEKLFKIFLICFFTSIVLVFIPLDLTVIQLFFRASFGLSAFLMSLYLAVRKRRLGDILFFFSIVCFAANSIGLSLEFGLAFNFFCYVFSFVFIGLVFSFATSDDKWDAASFFKIQKQLTQAKEQIKELEGEYETLFEAANDAIFVADTKTGLIVDCNIEATKLLEKPKNDIIGKHQKTIHPLEEIDAGFSESIENNFKRKDSFIETRVITQSGEIKDVSIKAGTFQFGEKKLMVGIFRDITYQKHRERALVEAQKKFEGLFIGNPEAVVLVDAQRKVLDLNPRFTQLFGYSLDEVKGRFLSSFIVPEERLPEAEQLFDKASSERAFLNDTVRKKKDGTLIPVSVSISGIAIDSNSVGFVNTYSDILHLKNVEDSLMAAMDHVEAVNEKLRVVGSLTRHDVNNKLAMIPGYAYMIKKKHPDQRDIVEGLGKMEQAVKEVAKIFEFAKAYEQLGVEELVNMDLERTVDEAAGMFSGLAFKVINDCKGLTILADSFLRQLIFNLIDNTRKYGETTTTVRIHYQNAEDRSLLLTYEDDGLGIPLENKDKLFKQGFSTGNSTGFGLFLIMKMIEVYGWEIEEVGEPGKGAKFAMTIPKLNKSGQINYLIQSR